ncbi:hypothetical protein R80B4_01263 [Fibrobacteres bacterium R8-0-B4]
MDTIAIDRKSLPETFLAYIGANPVVRAEFGADSIVFSPAPAPGGDFIDPDDYPDDTAYLNALPGAAERILAYDTLPDSAFKPVPRRFFSV